MPANENCCSAAFSGLSLMPQKEDGVALLLC